ncbi:hypothetical protein BC831DRAFT_473402 [Entophlyctis helioformis]|nr:hypothetical protein BC831DRAFT_473402 [Entophlyctis helioformis]
MARASEAASQLVVDVANEASSSEADADLLSTCIDVDDYDVTYTSIDALPDADFDWAFNLVKSNMMSQYDAAKDIGGWSDTKKRAEMSEPTTRFLILRSKSTSPSPSPSPSTTATISPPLAFLSFQYSIDDATSETATGTIAIRIPVAYIYELHVIPASQRRGLGAMLVRAVEALAARYRMRKLMLTVLKSSTATLAFYARLGFDVDETSPCRHVSAKRASRISYQILSKTACL